MVKRSINEKAAAYIKKAKDYESGRSFENAAKMYEKAGVKDKAKEMYNLAGKANERKYNLPSYIPWEDKTDYLRTARKMYQKAGNLKKVREIDSKIIGGVNSFNKSIDSIVSVIMLISGIFLLAYFLTLPSQIATQNAQLAPPMPSTAIVIVSLLLIAGVVYFMYTRAIKKRVSIPLSFA
jgi:hypothetical protein